MKPYEWGTVMSEIGCIATPPSIFAGSESGAGHPPEGLNR
jgi:hypothetical protein